MEEIKKDDIHNDSASANASADELSELKRKSEEYLNNWKRERADFINYKKEEQTRIADMMNYLNAGNALEIIQILDSFEIAEKNVPETLKQDENVKGILQIKKQALDALKNFNVTEIETLGKKFDPNFHEAIEEETKEGIEPGIITEEVRKGYLFKDSVLRPAQVKVSK